MRIQGEDIRVGARIRNLDCYSGHADATDLVDWLGARSPIGGAILLNHGEPGAVAALSGRLHDAGYRPATALLDQAWALTRSSAEPLSGTAARLAPGQATRPDWHNDRAAFLGALNERLQALPSDPERARLLATLEAALQG